MDALYYSLCFTVNNTVKQQLRKLGYFNMQTSRMMVDGYAQHTLEIPLKATEMEQAVSERKRMMRKTKSYFVLCQY